MQLSLGFSPCPNDTFMFDAMLHHRIDTEGLEFLPTIVDVEELNHRAMKECLDVTKVSYHAYLYLLNQYTLLNAGSALGDNVGPLLVARTSSINSTARIAIPGRYTTANLLLSLCFPEFINKQNFLFSDIEQAILDQQVDAGVIIHENRFTYQEKGLIKIADLGEIWKQKTGQLIPLGGIVVKQSLPQNIIEKLNSVLRKSIEYAFANPKDSHDFIIQHAQSMTPDVVQKHIALYVNQYSIDLGKEGKRAIAIMIEEAKRLYLIN